MVRILLTTVAVTTLFACDPTTPTGGFDTDDVATEVLADCEEIWDGRVICFPEGHVCYDPHGIGDGVPIEIDCHTAGSRACHPNMAAWPECAGGWEAE